jgi:hypothetical protein
MHKELVDYNKRLVILMGKLNRLHQAVRKGKGILKNFAPPYCKYLFGIFANF